MNSQNFPVNSHLLKFVSLCNDLLNNLLSNHTDDTSFTYCNSNSHTNEAYVVVAVV